MLSHVPVMALDAWAKGLLTGLSRLGAALTTGTAITLGMFVACAVLAVRRKGCCSDDAVFRSHVL